MTVMTAPAINKLVCGPASETKVHRPTMSGRQVSLVVTSSGHRNAFHEPIKAKIKTVKMGAWVVAATNHELEKDMADGQFREDLYYRLSTIKIHIEPPARMSNHPGHQVPN